MRQMDAYFNDTLTRFDLPLHPRGTEFQLKVWEALKTIPYGQKRSYQDIARIVGNVKAVRAVGGANNKNPISIIIPCHRVIGKSGKLIGYGGGLEKKHGCWHLKSGHRRDVRFPTRCSAKKDYCNASKLKTRVKRATVSTIPMTMK